MSQEDPALTAFKEYIIEEYQDQYPTFAAAAFKYFHHAKVKVDKVSKRPITNDTIRVSLKLCDKDMNGLLTKSISFENNLLTKAGVNALVNTSPDELENKFAEALPSILNIICEEYNDVILEMKDKISQLHSYAKSNDVSLNGGGSKHVIPTSFKGESIRVDSDEDDIDEKPSKKNLRKKKDKQVFDM